MAKSKYTTCTVEGCNTVHYGRGFCKKHYNRWKAHGVTELPEKVDAGCSVDGCGRKHEARGLCSIHYRRFVNHGNTDFLGRVKGVCSVDGCERPSCGLGFCSMHYSRFKSNGDPLKVQTRPQGTGNIQDGYLRYTNTGNRRMAHREIVENILGFKLPKEAIVHHVDGNRMNNEPTNLVVCPSSAYHTLIHRRQDALEKTGNANFRACEKCTEYDDPKNMVLSKSGQRYYHPLGVCKSVRLSKNKTHSSLSLAL